MQSIEGLKLRVHAWLANHELARNTRFYTREEWTARKEPSLADSDLALVIEGAPYRVMNGCDRHAIKLYDVLEKLVRRPGYYFKLGHAWSMGFYAFPARQQMDHYY